MRGCLAVVIVPGGRLGPLGESEGVGPKKSMSSLGWSKRVRSPSAATAARLIVIQALALHHRPAYEYESTFAAAAQEGGEAVVIFRWRPSEPAR